MIMEMVGNRSFTFTTGNGKRSRLFCLKNGVPQGSVMAPLLFKIYIADLPTTVSRKYAYDDDLAIMHADGDWQTVEGALSKDMATLGEYLQSWNVGQVAHVLPTPWVTSQEANITRRTLEAVCWLWLGCWSNNVVNSHPWPGHSTAEYCTPVWCHNAHTRLIDPTINDALWIVTGCLHPTPVDNRPILAGIQPAEHRRRGATLSLGCRHGAWTPAPLSAHPSIGCSCTVPQIETPICARHTTTHQFFWQQQHTFDAVGRSSIERGVGGQPHKTLHFNSRHRYIHTLEWPFQEELGSGSTASAPVSEVSAPACTNGVWPPLRPVSVAQNKP